MIFLIVYKTTFEQDDNRTSVQTSTSRAGIMKDFEVTSKRGGGGDFSKRQALDREGGGSPHAASLLALCFLARVTDPVIPRC